MSSDFAVWDWYKKQAVVHNEPFNITIHEAMKKMQPQLPPTKDVII